MIKNYFKIAFRNFWRHKTFTLINVIGLSIGLSAALVIYLIVQFDFNFDKFEKDGDRVYRVVTNFTFAGEPVGNPGVCGPLPGAVKTQVTGIETVAPFYRLLLPDVSIPQNNTIPLKFKDQPSIILTDKGYFDLIGYNWLVGSAKTTLNAPYQVVLTADRARQYFPDLSYEQMLGKTVIYDTIKTTITGIVQTLTQNSDFDFQDFISYSTSFSNNGLRAQLKLNNWGATRVQSQLFIKLFPNTTVAHIEKQLTSILAKNESPVKGKTHAFALQPLSDIHFDATYSNIDTRNDITNKTTLYYLLVIALFLLLLGCINFINLTTAQATQRAKEVGVRKTMGSSRSQLIFQFLSETFLITVVAIIISLIMVPFILKLFSGFIPAGIKADFLNRPDILLFLLILSVVVSLLSGFYPAIILSGYNPVSALKNQSQNSSSKTRSLVMRKSLIVTQFVVAQFFIMATMMVGKQIYYATHKELGFKKDGIIIINSPWKNNDPGRNLVLLNKLQAMPQIDMVSLGNDAPASENTSSTEGTYRDGKKEIKIEDLSEKFGDENYIKLYKIKLLAGRNLQAADANKAFLANLTLVKTMGLKNPGDAIGKTINDFNGDTPMQIVGVVSDFTQESLHAPIAPLVILTGQAGFEGTFHIALNPETANGNEWQKAIAGIQASWKDIYPGEDFSYQFLDESIAQLYTNEQHTVTLLTWATGLSVLISCLGLLGLAIYTTNQRTKEIGVRKVLGASVAQIVGLLSTEIVRLILLAFIIVTPLAWLAMNKWMQSFADRTTMSWWIFALSGAGMLVTAMFTSGFQTVKAAIANPVKSLRSE
jgi:putative ABC transport system permease protein